MANKEKTKWLSSKEKTVPKSSKNSQRRLQGSSATEKPWQNCESRNYIMGLSKIKKLYKYR